MTSLRQTATVALDASLALGGIEASDLITGAATPARDSLAVRTNAAAGGAEASTTSSGTAGEGRESGARTAAHPITNRANAATITTSTSPIDSFGGADVRTAPPPL